MDFLEVGPEDEGYELKEDILPESEEEKEEDKEYEDICYMCRRPEHTAGKMIKMPGGVCICADCMQRTFDTMNNSPFGFGMPMDMGNVDLSKMPNVGMIDLSSLGLFGGPGDLSGVDGLTNGIPNSQRLKKKKKKEEKAPAVLDINSIPAPHKIKASLDDY
ncbi:MAG: hypothetical protein J6R94_01495, partial [Agathobacter sp.]|nr:hypothetical protein [Agathobacter sp.]